MNPLHNKKAIEESRRPDLRFRAVVIGASAGGLHALSVLLPSLQKSFPLPVLIVQHRMPGSDEFLTKNLNEKSAVVVKETEDKEPLQPGFVYIAPANYHVLVERNETASLNVDPKVNFSRPSIDVLFESASEVWTSALIGVILTGANQDGARGMEMIRKNGGVTIAQSPDSAHQSIMPQAAIDLGTVQHILPLAKIGPYLNEVIQKNSNHTHFNLAPERKR